MKKRIYGFDAYKQFIKEGVYKPGFITEYEETSIDDVTPAEGEEAEPEQETEATSETDEQPEETPVEEAPIEEVPTDVPAETETAEVDQEFANKSTFVKGVFDEIAQYTKNGGVPDQSMVDKVEQAFAVINGNVEADTAAEPTTEEAPAEEADVAAPTVPDPDKTTGTRMS